MKSTTAVIGGLVVVVIVGVFIFYGSGNANLFSTSTTSTPTTSTNTDNTVPDETKTPGTPMAVTDSAASPTDTTVVVSGNVTPNGAFTSYWYEFGTTANLGNKSSTHMLGSGYAAITAPAYITELSKDTTYYFRLVAQNQLGTSAGLQYAFHTSNLGTLPPVGSAPTAKTLPATGITRTTANMAGEVTPNKASTLYWFEYGQSANLGLTSSLQSVGNGSTAVPASFSTSNLAPATTYYYRLNAQNQFGTVNGAIRTFRTSGPAVSASPVVTTQVASPVATTTATLRGTVNSYGTETSYWFEYSTNVGFSSPSLKTTAKTSAGAGTTTTSVEADITGLISKTKYYYRVVAQNSTGTVRGGREPFETK